jgi:hypothetical protein
MTAETITSLGDLRRKVDRHREQLENPDAVLDFIDHFLELFTLYVGDFDRLMIELPDGARETHLDIILQIRRRSAREEDLCILFSHDHINHPIKDESVRWLLDGVYREVRWTLIDYWDLGNLVSRLKTFVGSVPSKPILHDTDVLELKPNVFGIGLNLNHLIRRAKEWWRARHQR